MRITRMYTGSDDRSHFEECEVQFGASKEGQRVSVESSRGLQFVSQPPGFVIDMHPAPRRQYVITLQGQAEIVVSDGTARRFGPGDVMLAEDLTGEGHITRVVGDVVRVSVQIPI